VKQQYECYPYPDMDPLKDTPGLLVPGHLSLICKLLWGGQKDANNLQVLDAGCGTGGPLIAMAKSYPGTQFTGIDFSSASIEKAKLLARRYGVKNIRFFNISIENVSELNLVFDYIVCSGVLHHLQNPAKGLKALSQVLHAQGVISIMLYGKFGRTGIYMIQQALRLIHPRESLEKKLETVRSLLGDIPNHHPFKLRKAGREIIEGKDAGIVDLLLHANDIPFDVNDIYSLCKSAGLEHYRWLFPIIYNPFTYIKNPITREYLEKLDRKNRALTAELLHGSISKHSFFAVKPSFSAPGFDLSRGGWRKLKAWLTPCMKWNQVQPVPEKELTFRVESAVVQDEWQPLELAQWELIFLGLIEPGIPLGDIIQNPSVKRVLPFTRPAQIDQAVEKLLEKTIEMTALVLLV